MVEVVVVVVVIVVVAAIVVVVVVVVMVVNYWLQNLSYPFHSCYCGHQHQHHTAHY